MTIDKKLWRNRKERKELACRSRSEDPGLEVVHPHAAGVDVGNGAQVWAWMQILCTRDEYLLGQTASEI